MRHTCSIYASDRAAAADEAVAHGSHFVGTSVGCDTTLQVR